MQDELLLPRALKGRVGPTKRMAFCAACIGDPWPWPKCLENGFGWTMRDPAGMVTMSLLLLVSLVLLLFL